MKRIIYSVLAGMLWMTACSPAEDAIYQGPASVSFVADAPADLLENATEESLKIALRLTASEPLEEALVVNYSIQGENWQNRIADLNDGSIRFTAGEYLTYIELMPVNNQAIDGDEAFEIVLEGVSNEQVELGLGGSETLRSTQLMVLDDEYDPCTDLGDALINQTVVLDYYDYYDPEAYSGASDGTILKPEVEDCSALTVVGDAIYLFAGKFQLHVNEDDASVEIPQQFYGNRESRNSDYYIKSIGKGTYDATTNEVVVDILYYGYDAGIDAADVDLDADGYDGQLTISLK